MKRASPRQRDLIVFLGPSLPADEARALAPCTVLPPAKAGDVFAILPRRPFAIALVDGLFEGAPSIWHHELLAALDAGIAVYGGASMGALRAAELWPLGVVGVGTVFGWYRDGTVNDDDEVALYHAPPARGSRPYTVPLVDVRWAIAEGLRRGVVGARAGRAVLAAARALHFGERTWEAIFASARLSRADRLLLPPFFRSAPSVKAQDARATIRAAAEWAQARRRGARLALPAPLPPLPSHARRRRLAEARSFLPSGHSIRGAEVLAALRRRPDAAALGEEGLRRALLAGFARSLGLRASPELISRAERAWLRATGGRNRADALAAVGLDDGAARALFEDLALEALLLERAARVVPDGPSFEEGLAVAARLGGEWRATAARLARSQRSAARPRAAGAGRGSAPVGVD